MQSFGEALSLTSVNVRCLQVLLAKRDVSASSVVGKFDRGEEQKYHTCSEAKLRRLWSSVVNIPYETRGARFVRAELVRRNTWMDDPFVN